MSEAEVKNVGIVVFDAYGVDEVGGLVGLNEGIVEESYAIGEVRGEFDHVGSLVGYNWGAVNQSYSVANVSGN